MQDKKIIKAIDISKALGEYDKLKSFMSFGIPSEQLIKAEEKIFASLENLIELISKLNQDVSLSSSELTIVDVNKKQLSTFRFSSSFNNYYDYIYEYAKLLEFLTQYLLDYIGI